METELFMRQGKKLLPIAVLLFGVAMLVGGEDDPGVLTEISGAPPKRAQAAPPPQFSPAVQQRIATPAPPPSDPNLDSWYAQAGSTEIVDPTPATDDFLVNDTRPLMDTEPTR